ncbi:MAG: 2-amino-4-hydroxy-6-hydroxymethyldihydropteridine diphosphokinase, partial [Pararheinheimera sp.]|nr:2-amino-4-hydroxy-6-hydroxymethyldihydropteridine diphosphokinase [Rheinheimera sp.]
MADTLVYIGLGANLAQPVQQLEQAVAALQNIKDTKLVKVSSFYGSKPMGPQDQPDYVNAVAALHTRLAAEDLLTELQKIELEQGRQRKDERWG